MNRHSILLLAILVVIGIGLGAAVGYQRGHQAPLGTASAAPAAAPKGGGLVINGMAVGQPAPSASAPAASTSTPAAQVPAPAADSGTCP